MAYSERKSHGNLWEITGNRYEAASLAYNLGKVMGISGKSSGSGMKPPVWNTVREKSWESHGNHQVMGSGVKQSRLVFSVSVHSEYFRTNQRLRLKCVIDSSLHHASPLSHLHYI